MTSWSPYQIREVLAHLSERDLRILGDIERFRLLSTDHIRRLQFAEGHVTKTASVRACVRVLDRLEAGGFIARLARRIGGPLRGSSALVWQLAATGERVLRARRGEPSRRRFAEPSPHFTAHTLAISEFAVRLIEKTRTGSVSLLTIETEPTNWRRFTNALGSTAWLKPDLLAVLADAESESHVWAEIDLGTEHLPTVLRKCAVYDRYARTGIEQAARGVFPLVLWVVPDRKRQGAITRAIARERGLDGSLFAVTTNADALELLVPPVEDSS